MSLTAQALDYSIGNYHLLEEVNINVAQGELIALMGPNGAGKSSLLNLLAGCPEPTHGVVTLDEMPLPNWAPGALARRRAILIQSTILRFNFSVVEVIELGANPYVGMLSRSRIASCIERIMHRLDIFHLRNRLYTTLSGGECQRVQIARVLLQALLGKDKKPVYILLDEPLVALDIEHQHTLMCYLTRLAREGAGIVLALHDLNTALHYADRVCLLKAGRVYTDGKADDVIVPEHIRAVFNVNVQKLNLPGKSGSKAIVLPSSS